MAFLFYRDVFGRWRWEYRDANGGAQQSPRSYETRAACLDAAEAQGWTLGAAAAENAASAGPSVLCVQPDPALRGVLQQTLGAYRTVAASTGLEAIRILQSSVFDAYVIDYWLPPSSGIHLCRYIRRTDPHTPICFYTNAGSEAERRRAFQAGANAYVCASAGHDILGEELRGLLDQAELQSMRARIEEEQAVQDELESRLGEAIDRTSHARTLAAGAIERAARAKAYQRFSESGGTPGHFERWWPEVFSSSVDPTT